MDDLRATAHAVLVRMALISYGGVAALEARHGGDRDAKPSGESRPMHERWGERFEAAAGPVELAGLVEQARAELDAWLRRPLAPDTAESWDELAERITKDGWSLSAEECARSMRCTPNMVRRARLAQGKHPESGYALPERSGDVMAWARALDHAGLTVRQIAALTGVAKSTLHDRLGVVAHGRA